MKRIWRKNFEIKQAEYVMMSEAIGSFYKLQRPSVERNYLNEVIMVFANGDNTATYLLRQELRDYAVAILKEIIKNPLRLKAIQAKTIRYNRKFFKRAKEIEKVDYKKQSTKKLLAMFGELFRLMQYSHGYSLATTWFVDADGNDLTNYLFSLIKKKIREQKLPLNPPEVFSILTTPALASLAQKEEIEMLKILSLINRDKSARKLFAGEGLAEVEDGLKKLKPALRRKIISHYKKWRWTPYTYIGPAYNLDYYLSRWSSLVRQKVQGENEIIKIVGARSETIKRRHGLSRELNLNKKEQDIFDLAAQIVWLKAYRKDCLFYGMYIIDKVLKELGRRAGLSLMQMKYIAGQEMKNYKKFSPDELNQRYKFSVVYYRRGRIKILTGETAKKFLKKQRFEKEKIKMTDELRGTPAFVGKVRGVVRVVNLPAEMVKMEEGNIMVSHTTFPSLVPAMKKAAAIVTDDGGITCHAAIVARELKIPCVVGTKIATQIFNDGDLVEVDADQGIVKKIKDK